MYWGSFCVISAGYGSSTLVNTELTFSDGEDSATATEYVV
jgi:hypothetical protein